MITIVLADDHPLVRAGMRSILSREPDLQIAAEAANGREAVELCSVYRPNVAIIDVAMPELNGLEAARRIAGAETGTHVVMLSMHSDETYIMRALSAGVSGYLLKDSAEAELVAAVRNAASGRSFFSPEVTERLNQDYTRYLRQRGLADTWDILSPREREVLQLLAEGRSNKEVANLLDVSVTTVETHRTHLMQKLNLHSTAEIVLYAVRKKVIT